MVSKLLKLKDWVTVPDAARHLSIMFGEDVTEADVLRLALDGVLKLSINFVNGFYARIGKIVDASEARHVDFPADLAAAKAAEGIGEYKGGWKRLCMGVRLVGTDQVIDLEDEISVLRGVYDLPMIGGELLDIEHRYQQLTGGPEVTSVAMDGAFVEGKDGALAQLQDHHEHNPYMNPKTLEMPWHHKNNFYPGGNLPSDAVLVVRTTALSQLLETIAETTKECAPHQELSTRERDTLYKLIIGMAIEGYRYNPRAARNDATAEIAGDLAKHGIEVSDDTVRKWLKQAANAVMPTKGKVG